MKIYWLMDMNTGKIWRSDDENLPKDIKPLFIGIARDDNNTLLN